MKTKDLQKELVRSLLANFQGVLIEEKNRIPDKLKKMDGLETIDHLFFLLEHMRGSQTLRDDDGC